MDRVAARLVLGLGSLVAGLAALASAAGVLLRGDLASSPFVTARGELVQVVTGGVYRYNAEGIVAEGVGWDLVTLLLVVPATLATLRLLRAGSLRAALVMGGLLAYFAYQYFEYATFWAYGPLYPLHLLIAGLSVSALGILLWGIDLGALAARAGRSFPRRAVTAFAVLVVLVLCGLWLPTILRTLGGEVTDELMGATTLVVPAFDLGLLVPLAVLTALAVHRGLPIGDVLGIIILVKGVAMALAIDAMLLVEWQVSGTLQAPPVILFAGVAVVSLAIGVRAVLSVEPMATAPRSRPPVQGAAARLGS